MQQYDEPQIHYGERGEVEKIGVILYDYIYLKFQKMQTNTEMQIYLQ